MADNTNNMNGSMCKSNCGFFGNAACDGYCSKCYKDHVKRQNSGSAAGRVTPTTGISSTAQSASTSIAAAVTAAIANQSISQMNSISEIPVSSFKQPASTATAASAPATSNSDPAMSSESADTAGKMLPPLSPPPVTFSLESSDDSVPPLPQLTTSTSNSSAPIAIPGRLGAPASHSGAMSVPNDLCASMASTCEGDVASSIEMNNSLNANATLSTSNSSNDMAGKTKKRTRCVMDDCKRKVGLTGFDCRCGGLYCWEHRYSDKHNCLFDYKELGQDQIRKANPIVVGEKIAKI